MKTVSKSILVIGLIIIILFSSSSIALSGDKTGTMKETKDADFDTILSNALEKNYFTMYEIAELGQSAWGISTADFNNDDYLDFAVASTTSPFNYSSISIFYNDGSLGFIQETIYEFHEGYIDSLVTGDYDNDGDIDVLFSYSQTRISRYIRGVICLLLNDGTNHFGQRTLVSIRGFGLFGRWESRIHPKMSSADYDNDGDLDFLVGDNSGKIEFYTNNGDATFRTKGIVFNYDVLSWGVASADFNNDGFIDFVVSAEERHALGKIGHYFIKYNTGEPECFTYGLGEEIANPGSTSGLAALDYDTDGTMDVIGGPGLTLYTNQNSKYNRFYMGTLPESSNGYMDSIHAGGVTAGDFNNDGMQDIVTGGMQGVIRLFVNTYGSFPPTEPIIEPQSYRFEVNETYEYTFTIADINNDEVSLFINWGDGTNSSWLGGFTSGETVTVSHTWSAYESYTIQAKAKDSTSRESEWSTLTISPQKNNIITSEDGWNLVSIQGKCKGWSVGTILHFFNLWATPQPMWLFDVTLDTEIRINGELIPLEEVSKICLKGFIGTSFFPFEWRLYELQEIEPPHDITVFGISKEIVIKEAI